MKQEMLLKNNLKVIPFILLGFTFYVAHLQQAGLWFDEGFTWFNASATGSSFFYLRAINPVHPPGYFGLIKLVMALLNTGEYALRFPSTLAGILVIPLIFKLGQQFNTKTGLIAIAIVVLNPFLVTYAREARMYSILMAEALIISYLFIRLLSRPKLHLWLVFLFISSGAYITHYYTLFLGLVQSVYLIINLKTYHRFFRLWVIIQALAAIPLLIWVVYISQLETMALGIGWIQKPGLVTILNTFHNFSVGYKPFVISTFSALSVIFVLIFVWGNIKLYKQWPHWLYYLLWFWLPLVVAWLISQRRPIYFDRYFSIIFPVYILIIALGIAKLRFKTMQWLIVGLLVFGSVINSYSLISGLSSNSGWRGITNFVGEAYLEDDLILFTNYEEAVPFSYYMPLTDWQAAPFEEMPGNLEQAASENNRFWLIAHPTDESDQKTLNNWQIAHEKEIIEQKLFSNVWVILYEQKKDDQPGG